MSTASAPVAPLPLWLNAELTLRTSGARCCGRRVSWEPSGSGQRAYTTFSCRFRIPRAS